MAQMFCPVGRRLIRSSGYQSTEDQNLLYAYMCTTSLSRPRQTPVEILTRINIPVSGMRIHQTRKHCNGKFYEVLVMMSQYIQWGAAPRYQPAGAAFHIRHRAKPVQLRLEDPVRMIERRSEVRQRHRCHVREIHLFPLSRDRS